MSIFVLTTTNNDNNALLSQPTLTSKLQVREVSHLSARFDLSFDAIHQIKYKSTATTGNLNCPHPTPFPSHPLIFGSKRFPPILR